MHVLLLLICVLPGGSASTSASLEGSSDSKSPGRALAVTDSCRNVWGDNKCAKQAKRIGQKVKKSKCDPECSSKSCKKVQTKCKLACKLCTPDYEIIKALRGRLGTVAELLPTCDATKAVQCTCDDYCRGACFACGCSACAAATFSGTKAPGNVAAALCTAPGPLGTGLLCAVNVSSGLTTKEPCCTVGGQYCALPPGTPPSGCKCPENHTALYPPLPRVFDSSKNTCEEAPPGLKKCAVAPSGTEPCWELADPDMTDIPDGFLEGNTDLTGTLLLGSAVKTIGDHAFAETNLTGLDISQAASLVSIGYCAFCYNYFLEGLEGTLVILANVETIGVAAFGNTKLTGLDLSNADSLVSIGDYAFANTDITGTLVIPANVETIESGAFQNTKLTGLGLSQAASLVTIEDVAFNPTDITGTIVTPFTVPTYTTGGTLAPGASFPPGVTIVKG